MTGSNAAKDRSQARKPSLSDDLSEMEISLTVLWNSARRWLSKRSGANVINGLSDLDVFLLHMLVYRNQPLRGSDLAFALAIDDLHLISYALKKLTKLGLTSSSKAGKEVFYSATDRGRQHYSGFLEDRRAFLEPAMRYLIESGMDLRLVIDSLRALSGAYEQAARAAASAKGA